MLGRSFVMLEKVKALIKGILQYLVDHPVQRTILVAIGVAVVATIIALIIVGVKKKKQKAAAPTLQELATDETAATTTEPAAVEQTTTEAAAENVAEETTAVEETPAETVAEIPAETVAEAPAETVLPVQTNEEQPKAAKKAKAPNAAKSAVAATKKINEAIKAEEPSQKAAEEPKKAAEQPKKKATNAKSATPAEKAPAKKTAAKYTGKWVVCKLILTDEANNAVEENYFFELRASNGELLLTSEEYTTYAGALKGIQTHKDNVEKGNFRITLSKKGEYIFKLLTAKNTLLCTGANYKSLERCESAIASTKRFAASAILQEDVEELRMPIPADDEPTQPTIPDNGYTGKWIINTKGNDEVGTMYYFELFASNGEKLLTSEEYTTYEGAVNAVATHKANIAKGNFRISVTKKGDYLFKLLGGNGQLLCMGEHYKTRSRCESAVESVKRFSQSAPVYKYGEING